jgi:hypothetical protein
MIQTDALEGMLEGRKIMDVKVGHLDSPCRDGRRGMNVNAVQSTPPKFDRAQHDQTLVPEEAAVTRQEYVFEHQHWSQPCFAGVAVG